MQDLTQFRIDIKYLDKFKTEIGTAAESLVPHNSKDNLLDRHAELFTDEAMDAIKADKFKKGASMLSESQEHAEKQNPSFRERIKYRKSHPDLKVLSDEEVAQDKAKGKPPAR